LENPIEKDQGRDSIEQSRPLLRNELPKPCLDTQKIKAPLDVENNPGINQGKDYLQRYEKLLRSVLMPLEEISLVSSRRNSQNLSIDLTAVALKAIKSVDAADKRALKRVDRISKILKDIAYGILLAAPSLIGVLL
jgi:hypothetical protein